MSEEQQNTAVSDQRQEEYVQRLEAFVEEMERDYPDFATVVGGANLGDVSEDPEESIPVWVTSYTTDSDIESGLALGAVASTLFADAAEADRKDVGFFDDMCHAMASAVAISSDEDSEGAVVGVALQIVADYLGLPPLSVEDVDDEEPEETAEAENATD